MATTPYSETECLLAVMEGEEERAAEIAGRMTAREQRTFIEALQNTIATVEDATPTVL